jgi:hypothetical protein
VFLRVCILIYARRCLICAMLLYIFSFTTDHSLLAPICLHRLNLLHAVREGC